MLIRQNKKKERTTADSDFIENSDTEERIEIQLDKHIIDNEVDEFNFDKDNVVTFKTKSFYTSLQRITNTENMPSSKIIVMSVNI